MAEHSAISTHTTIYAYDGVTETYITTINTATVNDGGSIENSGTIDNVTVNGGTLSNNNSTIFYEDEAIVTLHHGTIGTVTQNSGTVNNDGQIGEMNYVAGTYNGAGTGTIGTLTIAGDVANNTGNWGTIQKLAFDNGGNGLITLTGSANPAMAMAAAFEGIMPAGNAALPGISFSSNITAQNIDFTYGNIALDLSALAGFSENDILSSLFAEGFMVASLFGNANVTGFEGLNSFELAFASGSLFVKSGGVFANGWSFADGFITWNGAEVPEPATLLMLGLSLAGLPIVRRFRKK